MLTNKELADGLEVPASRVTEWVKRKMPRDSIQAAAAWRMVHARPRGKNAVLTSQLAQDRGEKATTAKDTPKEVNGWEARLERTRAVEFQIYETLTAALAAGDVTVLQRLQAAHIAAVKEIAAAEKIALEVRIASKELIHRESAKAVLIELLQPLRDSLDKLPILERTNCNPSHPEIAQRALTVWRDRLLARGRAAENRF